MINANEVEIADWLDNGSGFVQVTSLGILGGDWIGTLFPFSSQEIIYAENRIALSKGARSLSELNPVCLDKDILKALGFTEVKNNDFTLTNDGQVIAKVYGEPGSYRGHIKGMLEWFSYSYVHQLQHDLKRMGFVDIVEHMLLMKK